MPKSTRTSSAAYATNLAVKTSPGSLLLLSGYNSKASAQFIQLHDAAALPADTAVPVAVITVAASSNFAFTIPASGIPFKAGIIACNSSTGPTKTIGSADCYFTAVHIP